VLSVDVVVVAYNSRDCLPTCLESLAGAREVSIIVVDNACPQRSYEVVERLLGVRVIHTGRNGGFAYGSNAGWRAGDSEFVLFLNPDARLDRDSLARMAQVLRDDSTAGVVGPRTHQTDGSLAWSIRRFPSLRSTYARAFFIHRLMPRAAWVDEVVRDPGPYARRGSVAWLPGTCLLARRTIDESFFMYVEDMDFCRRVRALGFDVVYCPDAVCVHEGGQSLSRTHLLPVLAASRLRYAKHNSGGAMRRILQQIGLGIGEGLQTVIGHGELGHRREHLRALGVILRGDEGYRLPGSAGTEARGTADRQRTPEVAIHDDDGLLHGLQRHFVTFLQVWVLLALLAIVGNEIVQHSIWDERELANGDALSAVLVVLSAFAASYFVGRRQRSQFVTYRAELTPPTPPDDV
jgi:GT2 family glycosyltransferase